MNKKDIISFFDRCASWWDDDMVRNEAVIATILDKGAVRTGITVLDVACGTGVLFPDYLQRGAEVTGIDISPEMVKIAQSKFPQLEIICGDVETHDFGKKFDVVMVYNAFPHFPQPAELIAHLASLLKEGGRLTVAHGMSRAALQEHHKRAQGVSLELPHEDDMAKLFAPHFAVDAVISNEEMYLVSGVKKA